MNRDVVETGVVAGAITAAAALGALLRMGARLGDPLGPLNAIAAYAVGERPQSTAGLQFPETLLGAVIHTVTLITAGVVARALWQWWGVANWVAATSASVLLLMLSLASGQFGGLGLAALLPLGDLLVLHLLIAATLGLGIRFALSLRKGRRENM